MTLLRPVFLVVALGAGAGACGFSGADGSRDGAPPVTVGFRDPTSLEDESSGTVLIPVVLSAESASQVTVGYTVMGGSATRGDDYTIAEGSISFAPGDVEEDLALTIVPDGIEEPDETIMLRLASATGGELGARDHVVTISSDILPRVRFTQTMSMAAESAATQFVVQLDIATDRVVSVDYSLTGAATAGADYTLAAGTINFPIGETMQTLMLGEIDDALDEDVENVIATLTSSVGIVIDQTMEQRTHSITDNDPTPSIGFASATSSQGEATMNGTITVSLGVPSGRNVSVNYTVLGTGTAGAGDVAIGNGTLSYAPGETTKTIPVTVFQDSLDEFDETADLQLSGAVNATIGQGTHTFTINDDDPTPTIQFQTASQTVTEANTTLNLLVTLSAVSGRDVSFQFAADGTSTATAGAANDYTFGTTSPVTIAAGAGSAMIAVTINDDAVPEASETIHVDLASPTNATVGTPGRHTITITDNDTPMTVSFDSAQSNGSADEGDPGDPPTNPPQVFTYDVVLNALAPGPITVDVVFSGSAEHTGGTVADPNDYTFVGVPVAFAAGQDRRSVTLTIIRDTVNEPGNSETITMTLANAVGATIVAPTSRNHVIVDDDN